MLNSRRLYAEFGFETCFGWGHRHPKVLGPDKSSKYTSRIPMLLAIFVAAILATGER